MGAPSGAERDREDEVMALFGAESTKKVVDGVEYELVVKEFGVAYPIFIEHENPMLIWVPCGPKPPNGKPIAGNERIWDIIRQGAQLAIPVKVADCEVRFPSRWKLYSMIESLLAQSPWISIKDGLPDENADVLVTDGKKVGCGQYWVMGDGQFWDVPTSIYGAEAELKIENPTHWMPLPEPPEVK